MTGATMRECLAARRVKKWRRRNGVLQWVSYLWLVLIVGDFIAQWIGGDFRPVWGSMLVIIASLTLFGVRMMGLLFGSWAREDYVLARHETDLYAARAAGRSEGIRDFQAAMIKEMRAQRQAREEAAQADAAQDGHAAHRYVQAQRLEIEGP